MKKLYTIGLIILTLTISQQAFPQKENAKSPLTDEQQIELSEGYSFISSRIIPENPDMLDILQYNLENLDFVRNSAGQMFRKIGPVWVNGIGDWVNTEGYLFRMFDGDELTIVGDEIDPQTPIALSTGYQMIGYLPAQPLNTEEVFQDVLENLEFVRNTAGFMFQKIGPFWVNNIGDMLPGEGYLVYMNAGDVLIYPTSLSFTCGDPFTDPRDEQTYTTVQIGDQCWMAENLNIGEMITGSDNMNNNGITKYCYDDLAINCDIYGGLYLWNDIMQYTTTPGVQSICPTGWHIPTDYEWCTLENEEDAGTVSCAEVNWRGIDAGYNLKSISGWYAGGNGWDDFGFKALPGGNRIYGASYGLGQYAYFWSSTEYDNNSAWNRHLSYNHDGVHRLYDYKNHGLSVRCVKDGTGGSQPCPGIPTVTYDLQVYNTILIGDQCWLKENLNVGTRIDGIFNMTPGAIEKYCWADMESYCDTYGGLYQWNEMMQYLTDTATQGICPPGWHLPTDFEWKILEGTVDNQYYPVGDPEWDDIGWRGYEAGFHLKSTSLWYSNGNGSDGYGFTALPGATWQYYGAFTLLGYGGSFWSSNESGTNNAWHRALSFNQVKVNRDNSDKNNGLSVRCLNDNTFGPQPCPGIPTVTWGVQVYNTALIGDQCWLKENLNIGGMILGVYDMTDNGVIEKYCYDDLEINCDEYGGLYQWNEMMQYVTTYGTQGICPDGWHIPTDNEIKILEGTVDRQYPVGELIWNNEGWRGFDAGLNLKSTSGWYDNRNGIDLFGFTALPGGFHNINGFFYRTFEANFWSSSDDSGSYAWYRYLQYNNASVGRENYNKSYGFSVRCLQD